MVESYIRCGGKFGFFIATYRFIQIFLFKISFISSIYEIGFGKIKLRKNTSDLSVYKQIFIDGEYCISRNSTPEIVVDLGANIGLFSIYISKIYPNAKVFCIEPDPRNFAILAENLSGRANFILLNNAIWNIETELDLNLHNLGGEWGTRVSPIITDKTLHLVASLTMNQLVKRNSLKSIDILKIDIEGAEENLFSANIEWIKFVKEIIIELHDDLQPGCSKSFFSAISSFNPRTSVSGENLVLSINSIQ